MSSLEDNEIDFLLDNKILSSLAFKSILSALIIACEPE